MKKNNSVALITGGGTGIGFAIAKKLHSLKYTIVITGRRKKKLIEARRKLRTRCHIIENDISDLKSIPSLVNSIEKKIGKIEILINNCLLYTSDAADE